MKFLRPAVERKYFSVVAISAVGVDALDASFV
jgi:hypothetical protein